MKADSHLPRPEGRGFRRDNQMKPKEIEAIEAGMAHSLLVALSNGTDMPCADLLDAIRRGVEEGIYRAAMDGAFTPEQNRPGTCESGSG